MTQHVIQRCVFPVEQRLFPLYYRLDQSPESRFLEPEPPGRFSIWIARGSKLITDTYFNSFYESYWRRYTRLGVLRLRLVLSGRGTVLLLRRAFVTGLTLLESVTFDGDQVEVTIDVPEPTLHYREAGALHFDIIARASNVRLERADWLAVDVEPEPMRMVAGYCTFNREKFLLANVRSLLEDAEVTEVLERVVVVDQGTAKVRDHPAFDDLPAHSASKLQVVEQANLGGAGGFTRSIVEARDIPDATHMLLMDDDAVTEPESVFRAAAFQSLAKGDVGVGGQMLDMLRPMEVYESGALVDPGTLGVITPVHRLHAEASALVPFFEVAYTHYNAWWFFAFPLRLIDKVGMPMPVFIRGDDVEFGYRLFQAGVITTTVPGMGIWHEPFYLKKGGWQAYYDLRNMLALTAVHFGMGRKQIFKVYLRRMMTQLLSMNYYEAEILSEAVDDYCKGPSICEADPQTFHKKLLALRKDFPQESVPRAKCLPTSNPAPAPSTRLQRIKHLYRCFKNQFLRPSPAQDAPPGHVIPDEFCRWWYMALVDVVAVQDWHTDSHRVYRRSREHFLRILKKGLKSAYTLYREHDRVSGEWRAAHARLTSPEFWDRYLGIDREARDAEARDDRSQRAA